MDTWKTHRVPLGGQLGSGRPAQLWAPRAGLDACLSHVVAESPVLHSEELSCRRVTSTVCSPALCLSLPVPKAGRLSSTGGRYIYVRPITCWTPAWVRHLARATSDPC